MGELRDKHEKLIPSVIVLIQKGECGRDLKLAFCADNKIKSLEIKGDTEMDMQNALKETLV